MDPHSSYTSECFEILLFCLIFTSRPDRMHRLSILERQGISVFTKMWHPLQRSASRHTAPGIPIACDGTPFQPGPQRARRFRRIPNAAPCGGVVRASNHPRLMRSGKSAWIPFAMNSTPIAAMMRPMIRVNTLMPVFPSQRAR